MKVISIAVFMLLLQPLSAQYNWSELDQKLTDNQKLLPKNFVCMIWKDDSIIFKKEYGRFNINTIKPIASCSKWLTAALVLQFVDSGKLSLDDKVSNYISSFKKKSKKDITIRHCLSQMTGIKDIGMVKGLLKRNHMSSLEEEVNSFARYTNREEPGAGFWYGNIGVNVAARVLEVISKLKFEELIQIYLFDPLDMTNTTFNPRGNSPVNPSGGAFSTPKDYMKFLAMLLNKGIYKGHQILSENAIHQMTIVRDKPENIRYAPQPASGYRYALGCWVDEEKNDIAISLACPGLFGTWPMIDYCRGYAFIIFEKNILSKKRAETDKEIKKIIDRQIASICN